MNCKPKQLAWIVVPRKYIGTGIEQIDGHVVKTLELVPGFPEPTWRVTPRQTVLFKRSVTDHVNSTIFPGQTASTDAIPDSFLRPFDPKSEPAPDVATRELEHAA